MKKSLIIISALLALASCTSLKEEFQPVFTLEYQNPAKQKAVNMTANTTIAELAARYKTEKPWVIDENIVISGIVSTTDKPGNFYKSLYIEDETGGIELKLGKNGLYNDYLPGQRIFVKCKGLTLGMYGYKSGNYGGNGMVQLGYVDPSGSYETSYLENQLLIDTHIFKGEVGTEIVPEVITEKQLPDKNATQATNKYVGKLVTLKGLKYANESFVLLYLDSTKDKKSYTNRIFLSDSNGCGKCGAGHGITTWAMSKAKMTEYLLSGIWDDAKVGSGNNYVQRMDENGNMRDEVVGDFAEYGYDFIEKAAYAVSQYFTMGNTEIQLRTSGYCKFSDLEIPASVLAGKATVDMTGILTLYQGSLQFYVNSVDDIVVNE